MTVFSFSSTILALRPSQLKLHASVALIIMGITDATISAIMTIVLYRNRSGYHRTNALLKNLILYALANGSLSTALLFANLSLFLRNPEAWGWIGLFFVYERLYVSSLLASLNIRKFLWNPVTDVVLPTIAHSNSPNMLTGPLSVEIEFEEIMSQRT